MIVENDTRGTSQPFPMIHDFFLKLDVIGCNYKVSMNDQLGDVLRGWKEGINAIKM